MSCVKRLVLSALFGFIVFFSIVSAQPDTIQTVSLQSNRLSTETAFEFGQVVSGEYDGGGLDHLWTSRLGVWLKDEAIVDKHLQFKTSLGLILWSPVPTGTFWQSREPYWSPSLGEAQAIYKFGDAQQPFLEAATGYFPFKYNPDARNLGEYMYRTQAYPPIVMNTNWIIVNRDLAYLTGLHLSQTLGPFHHDLLLTTETEYDPLWDFSLGYIASLNISNFATIGAGINFWRFWSVDEDRTSSKTNANSYVNGADTGYYTYKAIKAVARFSFDIKKLIPMDLLGKEDLKFYGEGAILGFADYGDYYDTISQRIPIMLGFNIPAFTLLDVFSFELEWFGSPYPNDMSSEIHSMTPQPVLSNVASIADDMKWSIFAERKILNGVTLRLQIARDHLRLVDFNEKRLFYRENLETQDDWYWMVQLTYGI